MKIEQIYTGCLAQGAYYLECNGEAAIIDPLREVQPYLERAKKDGAVIKYVFETHFHADFVSGHLTLAEKTGAPIIYGPNANPTYKATIAKDGQEFSLGNCRIRVLHTPGHTLESSCYLLLDASGKEKAIFTGDTLFLGDVGRPDLAQKGKDLTQDDLAGMLYDSLRSKIMPLADDLVVYPAHGAGSACGKNMSKETIGTLGEQKQSNYALRPNMTKDQFIKEVTEGLLPPPGYFPLNVKMNKEGYESIDKVLQMGTKALNPEEFEQTVNLQGALMLDVRSAKDFTSAHIPNSIFIGLDGSFAPWVGELVKDTQQNIVLIVDEDRVEEAVTRLARVGFDKTLGYLQGGIQAWKKAGKEVDSFPSIAAEEFHSTWEANKNIPVVDVRKESEFESGHVEHALNYPLSRINEFIDKLQDETPNYLHCAGGYRSVIAGSILKSRGVHNIINVEGGFGAIKKLDFPIKSLVNN